jgi:hypothetical protein
MDAYKSFVRYERKLIALTETAWETVSTNWNVVSDANGIHIANYDDTPAVIALGLEPGYEYRVIISKDLPFLDDEDAEIFLENDVTIQFMSELENMYCSVSSVLMYYPTFEPYNVAKQIYLNSQTVVLIDESATPNNINAVNYVKYATLWNCSMIGGSETSGSRIVLGDLEVENTSGVDSSLSSRWYDLMKQAEMALGRKISRVFAVKGENYPSSHQETRNWD